MAPRSLNSKYQILSVLLSTLFLAGAVSAAKSPAHEDDKAEEKTDKVVDENAQSGTNTCTKWGEGSDDSECQNVYINGIDDFCIFGPPGKGETVGEFERRSVAWCTKPGSGTRLIPEGTFTGVHFVETDAYVQVTGIGDLTKINMVKGDTGGELDYSGADGLGNPVGGKAYSTLGGNASGNGTAAAAEMKYWMGFVSANQFCFRACKNKAKDAEWGPDRWCQHEYDTLGCEWNMPADYGKGFDTCEGAADTPQGIYVTGHKTSTYVREAKPTPLAHAAPKVSKCSTFDSLPTALATAGNSGNKTNSHTPAGSAPVTNGTDADVKGQSGTGGAVAFGGTSAMWVGAGAIVLGSLAVLA